MQLFGTWLALLLIAAQGTSPSQAPAGPPPTDVYLATITRAGETFTLGKPENISSAPGYDNQPSFAPDGAGLYFTSARAGAASPGAASQTDIYRYDVKERKVSRVTETPESEYSPTVTPDGRYISVIRVEGDQTQRLWRFTREGGDPALVLTDIKPVGYHAWLSEHRLALFVLGQPATLQLADTRTGKADVVASNIGQSVQKIPSGGISFVQAPKQGETDASPVVMQLSLQNDKPVVTRLVAAVAGARQVHVAWMPDGTLLTAHDGALHAWRRGDAAWRIVADLTALGLKGVTRLAVNPKGDRLALVASE